MSGVSASPSVRPSMVVIFFPCASMASTEQAYTVLPSINTVQAPHTPRSQTRFAPVRLKLSRRASRRVTRGSSWALSFLLFTMSSIGTFPGPWTATSSPAALTTVRPTSSGTATPMPEIFMKSRRVTPELCPGLLASSFMAPPSLQSASITPARASRQRRGERLLVGIEQTRNGRLRREPPSSDTGSFGESLFQGADVFHQVADLRVSQLSFVCRHLAFAVGYGARQICIRHLLYVGAAEVLGSHRGFAATIGPVAHGALGLVVRGSIRRGYRRQRQSDHKAEQSDTLEQSHRHLFPFPLLEAPLWGRI